MQNRKFLSIISLAAALATSAALAQTSLPPSGTPSDSLPPAMSAAPDTAKQHDMHLLRRDHDVDEHTTLSQQNRHRLRLPGQRDTDAQEAMHDPNVPVYPPSERDWHNSPN